MLMNISELQYRGFTFFAISSEIVIYQKNQVWTNVATNYPEALLFVLRVSMSSEQDWRNPMMWTRISYLLLIYLDIGLVTHFRGVFKNLPRKYNFSGMLLS